jgi:transposase
VAYSGTVVRSFHTTPQRRSIVPRFGRVGFHAHDYKRHGTTTLFAALNVLEGTVLGTCMARHRHQEWLTFLRLIDQNTTAAKHVHLIVDNYSTHKHARVRRWLAAHPSTATASRRSRGFDFYGNVLVWTIPGIPGPEVNQWPMYRQNPALIGALPPRS